MKKCAVSFMVLILSHMASAVTWNNPSLSDAAYYVPYEIQGGDVSVDLVTEDEGLLMSCYNYTQSEYMGFHPVGTGLWDWIDGFNEGGKFGYCLNGSDGWLDINMVDDNAPLIQQLTVSFWMKRDRANSIWEPYSVNRDGGMAYLWEVRDGWSLDEQEIDLEFSSGNTNVNYPQLQVDYRDGDNKIKIGYNGGGGWQEFVVNEMLEDENWHNIIIQYQGYYSSQAPYYQTGTDIDLFIDGVEIASTGSDFVANGWGAVRVEAFGFGTHVAKSGMGIADDFDDLAIWTRLLSPSEIAWIANGSAPVAQVDSIVRGGGYAAGDFDKNSDVSFDDFLTLAASWLDDCTVIDCGQTNDLMDDILDLPNVSAFSENWLTSPDIGPVMSIEQHNGAPTFKVDDEYTTAGVFSHDMPYSNNPVKGFADIGTIIQDFGGMDLQNWWRSDDPYLSDYRTIVWRFSLLLETGDSDPDALAMPWITMNAPQWWANDPANEDELEVIHTSTGTVTTTFPDSKKYASLASTKWRQEAAQALENYIDFLYLSGRMNNIAGFKISDTGCGAENLWRYAHDYTVTPGYGLRTLEAFRQWLRDKYNNDIGELETSWKNSSINSFDNVQIPSRNDRMMYGSTHVGGSYRTFRDVDTEMDVIDFEQFWNELVVDTMDYFAGVIKRKTNHTKLVGGFYCYFYEWCGNPQDGHQALGKYNDSENLDFVWQTSSYQNRTYQAGADNPRGPSYTTQLHGKQWMHSNDTATSLAQSYFQTPPGSEMYAYTDTVEKNRRMFLRSAGFNICNNGLLQEFFTLWDGWYDSPSMLDAAGQVNAIYIDSKNHDRSSNAEVLIISDEVSCFYTTYSAGDSQFLAHTLRDPQVSFNKMGTQADHILLDDISLLPNPDQYKLVIFLNCYHMTDAQRTLVESLKNNGRVLMFCYAPGYFNGNSVSANYMKSLLGGMDLIVGSESLQRPLMQVHSSYGYHQLGQEIRSKIGSSWFGTNSYICKRIWADVSNANRIARDPTYTSHATMAIRDNGTWKAIYAVSSDMPPEVYREIAKFATVHIYNDNNDTFYVNSSYVCLHPDGSGSRTINFPQSVTLYDTETGSVVASNTDNYTRYYDAGETKLYRYE